jgi:deoxycytidylate deaminase
MQLYGMREIPGWDQYYLDICKVVAARSKDPHTQIGCVIIGPNHEIRSTGYNSFPRGIRDDVPERLVRPTKYLWIEHAERNAICNGDHAVHGLRPRRGAGRDHPGGDCRRTHGPVLQ